MSILDVLKQYADPAAPPTSDVSAHFDQVAQQASPADLGKGVTAAFRDGSTPSFGPSVGNLFGQSNPQQQAGVLNELVRALPTGALASLGGGLIGKLFGNTGQSPTSGQTITPTITPEQASQLSPDDVSTIASHAETHDGSIVDKVGTFYGQHPDLVKSMGAAALAIALGHLHSQR